MTGSTTGSTSGRAAVSAEDSLVPPLPPPHAANRNDNISVEDNRFIQYLNNVSGDFIPPIVCAAPINSSTHSLGQNERSSVK